MATQSSKKTPSRKQTALVTVDAFLAALDHPHKPELLALRETILAADSRVSEGIKWNAPSFLTSEYFATFHLRAKAGVQIILHLGAKKRAQTSDLSIADPESLLHWLGADRAAVTFRNLDEVNTHRDAFTALIRAWIKHV